jgi:hypothetical protein
MEPAAPPAPHPLRKVSDGNPGASSHQARNILLDRGSTRMIQIDRAEGSSQYRHAVASGVIPYQDLDVQGRLDATA